MSYKLKHESISTFSTQVAALICSKLFIKKEKIDGESLSTVTKVGQVNSFVVRGLFSKWQDEMQKLESPYFDFENKEVKKGLSTFMDLLSNHISISRINLEPLLIEALEESTLLMFDPKTCIKLSVESNPNFLKGDLKYIKCHQQVFKELWTKDVSVSNLEKHLNGLLADFETVSPTDFLDQLNASDKLEMLFTTTETPTKPAPAVDYDTVESPKQSLYIKPTEPNKKQVETINDKFNGPSNGTTLAEKLQKTIIKSIDKSLSLNERIMFTNTLFKGDKALMSEALSQIDAAASLNEAINIAMTFNEGWKMDSDEIEAFMEAIERKFH